MCRALIVVNDRRLQLLKCKTQSKGEGELPTNSDASPRNLPTCVFEQGGKWGSRCGGSHLTEESTSEHGPWRADAEELTGLGMEPRLEPRQSIWGRLADVAGLKESSEGPGLGGQAHSQLVRALKTGPRRRELPAKPPRFPAGDRHQPLPF